MARKGRGILLFLVLFAVHATAQKVLATIPVPSSACCYVAVNGALNKIYVSGGASANQQVFVVDGSTFKGAVAGDGSGASVDSKTGNYWAATVYGGSAVVRSARDNLEVARIPVSHGCPVLTAVDVKARRAWLVNQCGEGGDPVYLFDADNLALIAGPIATGGVLTGATVNFVTGRLYVGVSGISKRIDPSSFQVTGNSFGPVLAADPASGQLYAVSGTTLQIVHGTSDPEAITASVALGYSPSGAAVNHALGRLYLSNPARSCVEVRDISTGRLLAALPLPAGANPGSVAVDSTLSRLYVLASRDGKNLLYAVQDASAHSVNRHAEANKSLK
jgi:DNA-binding beta-propeller fold protein YncE